MMTGDAHHDHQHVVFYLLQSAAVDDEQYVVFVYDNDQYDIFILFFIFLSR